MSHLILVNIIDDSLFFTISLIFYSLIISVHNWLIAKTFLLYQSLWTKWTMDNPMDITEKCPLSIATPMDMSIANTAKNRYYCAAVLHHYLNSLDKVVQFQCNTMTHELPYKPFFCKSANSYS